jgi:hypothetical protein
VVSKFKEKGTYYTKLAHAIKVRDETSYRGTANFVTVTGTPLSNTHLIVTGNVAAELAVPHAVIHAGLHFIHIVYGFCLVTAKKIAGMIMKRCSTMPTSVPPIKTPRFKPISARSRRKRLGMMRKNTPMGAR